MSHTKSLFRASQQNNISLELTLARFLNASVEEISEALKKIPPEKTVKLAYALLVNASLEDISEVLKQVPREKTGEIAYAIGQVWQKESD